LCEILDQRIDAATSKQVEGGGPQNLDSVVSSESDP
jgi:hypothetical protein